MSFFQIESGPHHNTIGLQISHRYNIVPNIFIANISIATQNKFSWSASFAIQLRFQYSFRKECFDWSNLPSERNYFGSNWNILIWNIHLGSYKCLNVYHPKFLIKRSPSLIMLIMVVTMIMAPVWIIQPTLDILLPSPPEPRDDNFILILPLIINNKYFFIATPPSSPPTHHPHQHYHYLENLVKRWCLLYPLVLFHSVFSS